MMALTYTETRVRQSEMLQLLLLDALYGHSGSQHIVFQGGTALRWVYGGPRFSEDLDFVTRFPPDKIQSILTGHLFLPYSSTIILVETPEEI
jgi:predicted nucleotidyltransferase component of viral defense system